MLAMPIDGLAYYKGYKAKAIEAAHDVSTKSNLQPLENIFHNHTSSVAAPRKKPIRKKKPTRIAVIQEVDESETSEERDSTAPVPVIRKEPQKIKEKIAPRIMPVLSDSKVSDNEVVRVCAEKPVLELTRQSTRVVALPEQPLFQQYKKPPPILPKRNNDTDVIKQADAKKEEITFIPSPPENKTTTAWVIAGAVILLGGVILSAATFGSSLTLGLIGLAIMVVGAAICIYHLVQWAHMARARKAMMEKNHVTHRSPDTKLSSSKHSTFFKKPEDKPPTHTEDQIVKDRRERAEAAFRKAKHFSEPSATAQTPRII